ncbi:hypothetical protein SAMN05421688_2120 [Poseidonocella pacifica]|uniref:Uncharacterized protein n=1 Tax=Poseidonocella pacifica TaxID=871651 RepID=A0A1I0XC58_9RHOB|nr:hypothetical protein SAMN05421688_2120 [Poseidonocella pacifica]
MIVKIVTVFLAGMAVLAMFGRLRFPGRDRLAAARCPHCRRLQLGRGPCSCRDERKG